MIFAERVHDFQDGKRHKDRGLAPETLQEQRLRALINASSEVIYRMSPDWTEMHQLQGNGLLTSTEYTKSFWLQDYIPHEEQSYVIAVIKKAIQEKSVLQLEHRVRLADGSLGWIYSRAIPIMDEKDEIVEWFGSAYDITERKRKEENLALLAEISDDLAGLFTAEEIMKSTGEKIGKFLNITACRFCEINEEFDEAEVKYSWHSEGIPYVAGVHKLSSFVNDDFRQVAREGKTVIINNTQADPRADAKKYAELNIYSYIWVPFHRNKKWKYLFTIADTNTRIWRKDEIELVEEVTSRIFPRLERAYTEATMRASEEKYRVLFEQMSEGLSIWEVLYNNDGFPVDFLNIEINKAYEEHTGLKATNIIGKTLLEIVPDLESSWIHTLTEVAISREPVKFEEYNRSTGRFYETNIFSPKKDQIAILLRNITERKILEDELKNQKDLLEAVIENMHDALVIFKPTGEIKLLNAETRKMYPHFNENTTYRNIHDGFQYYDLDDNVISRENLPTSKVFKGQLIRNEKLLIKGKGKNQYTAVNATPIFDKKGNLTSIVVGHRDITEKIMNQKILREQQEKILNSEKEKRITLEAAMKLKDEFLYLVTHEFKTPMTVISASLQAIEFICKDDVTEKIGKYLSSIKTNTNRQLRLVNNLLDITKISSGTIPMNMSKIDIVYKTKLIVNAAEKYAKKKRITINFLSNINKKEIHIDEEKFERIILNLLSNAMKFTSFDKSINVNISVKKYKSKDFIKICVQDEGDGIPIEKQELIFERFGQVNTSLSRPAEGVGLGLYLVTLLVKAMSGEISIESEEGKGSIFMVLLPVNMTDQFMETYIFKKFNKTLISEEEKIEKAIAIEFSDIYFD